MSIQMNRYTGWNLEESQEPLSLLSQGAPLSCNMDIVTNLEGHLGVFKNTSYSVILLFHDIFHFNSQISQIE